MSDNAAKVLEGAAQKYASEAIRFDSQGARGMAIKNYQNAIQTLVQLAQHLSRLQTQQHVFADQALPGTSKGASIGARNRAPGEDDMSSGFTFTPPSRSATSPKGTLHLLHTLQPKHGPPGRPAAESQLQRPHHEGKTQRPLGRSGWARRLKEKLCENRSFFRFKDQAVSSRMAPRNVDVRALPVAVRRCSRRQPRRRLTVTSSRSMRRQ